MHWSSQRETKTLKLSEIKVSFSDKMNASKPSVSVEKLVLRRIRGRGRGSVFTPRDFLDLGSRAAVDQALSRLVKKEVLKRAGRGVYSYPKQSGWLGELSPAPIAVAEAMARRGSQKLMPSGALAANLLGLSDQVPARMVYLTDGPSRKAMLGKLPVVLRRSTPARLATAGRVSGDVAQALRFLRKEQVDDEVIVKLRKRLGKEHKEQLLRDIPLVPAWVGEIFRKVAEKA